MLFDTHAHMDDRAFDADREALLSALPEQGIGLLMNPGCSLVSSRAASLWRPDMTTSTPLSAPTRMLPTR